MTYSYFSRWANATLEITIPSDSAIVTDPITGNKIPASETLTFSAILKQRPTPEDWEKRSIPRVGQDIYKIYLEGWLVSPKVFPDNIKFPVTCLATIDGREGNFYIPNRIINPYLPETRQGANTGHKIYGFYWKKD